MCTQHSTEMDVVPVLLFYDKHVSGQPISPTFMGLEPRRWNRQAAENYQSMLCNIQENQ